MKGIKAIKYYSPIEEKINTISHAIGFILSITAFGAMVNSTLCGIFNKSTLHAEFAQQG